MPPQQPAFSFGTDPEFIFVGLRPDGTNVKWPADQTPVASITNHRGLGQIGRNGWSATAELRSHPKPTLEAMAEEVLNIINVGARQLRNIDATRHGFTRFAMMFGAYPHRTFIGGHIHITTRDTTWYYSKEAIQVLPFFISLISFVYDKKQAHRSRSSFGKHGDRHPSPDRHFSGRTRPTWRDGTTGWEYRTPPSWIGPNPTNQEFKNKLFEAIKAVIYSDEQEKTRQYDFLKAVYERIGGNIYKEVGANSRASYDRVYTQIKNGQGFTHPNAYRWSSGFFTPPTSGNQEPFKQLLRAVKDTQEDMNLSGFGTLFSDIDPTRPFRFNLNPESIYPPPTPSIPIPTMAFGSMEEAINSLRQSYSAYVGSTNKEDWISFGKAWYDIFSINYTVNDGVARDRHVPDITHTAFALCVHSVQRQTLKVKFLPRVADRSMIYGGSANRFPTPQDVVLFPANMAHHRSVRELMATEGYNSGETADSHLYLSMQFRDSASDLRYIATALYILWTQKYINLGEQSNGSLLVELEEEEEVASGLGSLFG